ncbi:MAG: D-alanine--D-alanine ligase [Syntrophomonadaceae bacterium]|nr:D-alanine--D-alanine ligase [Syntrophomonadaceae bacterium]
MRIAVLMGGRSKEREVSLRSGRAVVESLKRRGYEAIPVDADAGVAAELQKLAPDLAFIALHGRYGEDGSIQGLLEMLDIPYTGCGVASSAICMDKVITKKLLVYEGIPTAPFLVLKNDCDSRHESVADIMEHLGMPIVIKPSNQGSSIGTTIVKDSDQLGAALDEAFALWPEALAEKFIEGVEVTSSVLGNDYPRVLPLIEINTATGVYDYKAKYTPGGSSHIIPARVSKQATRRVEEISRQIYLAFRCLGFARIDFIIDSSDQPYVLEVNNIPGLTELSLFPDAAAHAGMSYDDLVENIVNLARKFWGLC